MSGSRTDPVAAYVPESCDGAAAGDPESERGSAPVTICEDLIGDRCRRWTHFRGSGCCGPTPKSGRFASEYAAGCHAPETDRIELETSHFGHGILRTAHEIPHFYLEYAAGLSWRVSGPVVHGTDHPYVSETAPTEPETGCRSSGHAADPVVFAESPNRDGSAGHGSPFVNGRVGPCGTVVPPARDPPLNVTIARFDHFALLVFGSPSLHGPAQTGQKLTYLLLLGASPSTDRFVPSQKSSHGLPVTHVRHYGRLRVR